MARTGCFRPLAFALALALAAGPTVAAQSGKTGGINVVPHEKVAGAAIAVEGDLLTIGGRPIRLLGIDAPDVGETCQNRYGSVFDCFAIALGVLKALIEGGTVECTIAERDRNGQEAGECRVRGIDLGAAMVARGWAFAYRSLTPAYQANEAFAQSHRIGLWSGKVEKPWQWRSRRLRENVR